MDITNCDREPIHIPGSIQPHGLFLTVEEGSERIVHAAGDFADVLGYRDDPVGQPLAALVGTSLKGLIGSLHVHDTNEPLYVGSVSGRAGLLDMLAHGISGLVALELEPSLPSRPAAARLFASMREADNRIRGAASFDDAYQAAAEEVRAATGFDRVMIYQFLDDETGRVVGESLSDGVRGFLGHRFPGGDIPRQARALYLRNVIRVIPNVHYEPQPLRGGGALGALDLSDSSLRSVSPIHVEYLKNMRVGASMSVSLIKNGSLWGLIACHNGTPLLVPYESREACKAIAASLMMQVQALRSAERTTLRERLASGRAQIVEQLAASTDLAHALGEALPAIQALMVADGVIVRLGDRIIGSGAVPPDAAAFLAGTGGSLCTNDLEGLPGSGDWRQGVGGGLLVATVGTTDPLTLAWLRARRPEVVEWAGNPNKAMERDEETGALSPRRSFENWRESSAGLPLAWREPEEAVAHALALDIDRLWRQQRLSALQSELIHASRISAMGTMASAMAHELNQPITAVANYMRGIQQLLATGQVEAATSFTQSAEQAALRAGAIVRRLRAMVSKRPPKHEAFQLAPVVTDALAIALPDAKVRGIDVDVDLAPGAEAVVSDPVQVQQVLTNLIRNAAEAMEGRPERRLAISSLRREANFVELCVRDTGIGVPEHARESLFAPFTTSKAAGMGIGLSICRTIVENHGGQIWLDEAVMDGTAIRFTLYSAPGEPD